MNPIIIQPNILTFKLLKGDGNMIGIYKITNTINNHSYIGLSNDIKRRWQEHRTPKNIKNRTTNLAKAFRKYGIENFKFEVLEECSINELAAKEQFYIEKFKPEYNMNEGGKGNLGHKLSKEFKQYLSQCTKKQWENMTTEQRLKIIKNNLKGPAKGHEVSKETREKLRQANLGKKQSYKSNLKRSKANKVKMLGNKNGNKRVAKIDAKTGETLEEFESIKIAAQNVGIHGSGISSVLKGRQNTAGGYYWRYL
jgi:group I intron endonuclease